MKKRSTVFWAGVLIAAAELAVPAAAAIGPIFPAPRESSASAGDFGLDQATVIAIPASPSRQDLFLAQMLAEELGDRFDLHLRIARLEHLAPAGRLIVMGTFSSPLVAEYCASHALKVDAGNPGPEGYILRTRPEIVVIAGSDDRGAFYGLQSLRQLAVRRFGALRFTGYEIRDWPTKPFRGFKLYLPGRNNIPFFKRFVRDTLALYKYNTLIVEMNASMRFERHPELNSAWVRFSRETNYWRRNYPPGAPHDLEINSSHQDTADGGFLEKDDVADLARYARRFHFEFVPELPSFTHSYYLLSAHPELSEVPGELWPDTYCPSNPESYKLLFDVYDEYIDLLQPRMVHAGHDELFQPVGLCPRCGDKDIRERYGEDVRKIHGYLAGKGVRMAIWGDMLLEGVRGVGLQKKKAPDGFAYNAPGGMTREQVARLIPKDVLIFNWFWSASPPEWNAAQAAGFERQLDEMGFQEIYGNFTPGMEAFSSRIRRNSILGAAPSAWFATNETGFGKDLLSDLLSCAQGLWSGDAIDGPDLSGLVQQMAPDIRIRFRGYPPPSRTERAIEPVSIANSFNASLTEKTLGVDLTAMSSAAVSLGGVPFDLSGKGMHAVVIVGTDGIGGTGLPKESGDIAIGIDATSLIFLHASARPATNKESFRLIYDQEDTADLLGWYEVVYSDGFVTTIPIRYGVNIQEWNWAARTSARDYCYAADPVVLGGVADKAVTFFAYEWTNPRLGQTIASVRLKGTTGFRGGAPDFINGFGPVIPNNAVYLKAISAIKKRG
ncbi:MAG TPA: glycoside hydrolase family 20 zincin-like fold domain-containing protein [Bryobacteraceae bacterium]|nr:glycoside hydrolase family 20 zincin-like fold domain-containing protein [Bryobacteraceae bacterium]